MNACRRVRADLFGQPGAAGDPAGDPPGAVPLELLDTRTWVTRQDLASAIFEWIEAWYNPRRRHSALGYRIPVEYERIHHTAVPAAA